MESLYHILYTIREGRNHLKSVILVSKYKDVEKHTQIKYNLNKERRNKILHEILRQENALRLYILHLYFNLCNLI